MSSVSGAPSLEIPALPATPLPAIETVERSGPMLRSGLRTGILLAGNTIYGKGLTVAGRIAAATGAKLFCPYPITRLERSVGITAVGVFKYVLEMASSS